MFVSWLCIDIFLKYGYPIPYVAYPPPPPPMQYHDSYILIDTLVKYMGEDPQGLRKKARLNNINNGSLFTTSDYWHIFIFYLVSYDTFSIHHKNTLGWSLPQTVWGIGSIGHFVNFLLAIVWNYVLPFKINLFWLRDIYQSRKLIQL